jgi:phosphomannomutase/phosphoglucomutase
MDLTAKYRATIARRIQLKRKLTVVVDAGNGVGGKVAVPLFEKLGCEVIPLYCEVDGNFPNHHPDPTIPSSLKKLISTVKRQKADLGIAFDGDADRIGAVDEKGNIIPGDMLLMIFARSVLKDKPGTTVIGEVKCSRVLYQDIEKHGGKPVMWMAGHSLIKDAMQRFGALIAGEMSGHMFFKHRWYGFDCAVYAGARLLEIVAASRKPFSAHFAGVPKMYATEEIRIETTDSKKFQIVEKATKYFKAQGLDVNTIDGARIEFPDGWGLLRVSNTSPMLVMRCEAETRKRLKEIQKLIEDKVAELK